MAAEAGVPVNTTQEWYRLLVDLKVANLRIHSGPAADEPSIKTLGSVERPVYQVHGRLTSRGELLLPGGRFTVRDRAKLATWLTNLQAAGPGQPTARGTGPFGLTREQLAEAHAALAQPLDFATRGLPHAKAVAQARLKLKLPVVFEVAGNESAAGQEAVTEELQGLSCGTALAYLLRPAGLGLAPRVGARGGLELSVRPAGRSSEAWPVGWPPGAARPLPELFQSFTSSIDDVTVAETLGAIEERLKAPVLFDRYALARHGIDPAAVRVTLPEMKTSYSQLLTRVLSKAKLKYELRIDEAGKPLLWITTMLPAG
ncbi:MAG: hypothetical protein HY000_13165 [Planctomycetes bacterium]|nr:hypothetical protein [Planctomycetota bacterium]